MHGSVLCVCVCALLLPACSQLPTAQYGEIQYDYVVASPYKLTPAHKNIYFALDAEDVLLPAGPLLLATLNLKRVLQKSQAQVVVYIHMANSFLISRPAGMRREVPIQRAHIRTHYNVEVVDVLADTLIDQFSGAGNYPIEALDFFAKPLNRQALKEAFNGESGTARHEVVNTVWTQLTQGYLQRIEVIFAHKKYRLVSELAAEPKLAQAFGRLKQNNKQAAVQALRIYNGLIKKYNKPEDETSEVLTSYIEQGITVSTSIINHEHEDRYP